jgi:hypothetical protein
MELRDPKPSSRRTAEQRAIREWALAVAFFIVGLIVGRAL